MPIHNPLLTQEQLNSYLCHNAAVNLQKYYRGHHVRSLFRFNKLSEDQQVDYATFVRGNDPKKFDLDKYKIPDNGGPLLLVGTSGLRSVELACELGENNKKHSIPKIYLIDQGKTILKFWIAFKKLLAQTHSEEDLENKLNNFMETNHQLFEYTSYDDVQNEKQYQEVIPYVNEIIQQHGFSYVKAVVNQAVVIPQDWNHTETFQKIKNYISHQQIQNVFVYPSNIIDIESKRHADMILNNIALLEPKLAIHTVVYHTFKDYQLIENNQPVAAKAALTELQKRAQASFHYHRFYKNSFHYLTNEEFSKLCFTDLLKDMDDYLKQHHANIDVRNSSFLIDSLFKIICLDIHYTDNHFEYDKEDANVIFTLKTMTDLMPHRSVLSKNHIRVEPYASSFKFTISTSNLSKLLSPANLDKLFPECRNVARM